jgi:hypothetical protein
MSYHRARLFTSSGAHLVKQHRQLLIRIRAAMKNWTMLAHGAAIAVLVAAFGGKILSLSIDLARHVSLVDEIMKHGMVRDTGSNIGVMAMYPPLAHWVAAVIGWISGSSGLVAIWLSAIVAVYAAYYSIGRLVLIGSPFIAAPLFLGIFLLLAKSHAQIGWEIIGNFFYPQIVGFAVYFGLIFWLARQRTERVYPALLVGILSPIVYLIQPISGVHLTASVGLFLIVEAVCIWAKQHRLSLIHIAGAASVGAAGLATLAFEPKVRVIILIAGNNGGLGFYFPYGMILLPVCLCVAMSLTNLTLAMRHHSTDQVDRIIGSAGVAAGVLMLLQYLAFVTLGSGSPYAVKKHVFIVVTIGAINLARLLAKRSKIKPLAETWQSLAAVAFAFLATVTILWRSGGLNLEPFLRLQRFATYYAETNKNFRPGQTAVSSSAPATIGFLVSTTILKFPVRQAIDEFALGAADHKEKYLLIDRPADALPCDELGGNIYYEVVLSSCLDRVPLGTPLTFNDGGTGLRFIGAGWSAPEPWGIWGTNQSKIVLTLPPKDYKLTAKVSAFLNLSHSHQAFNVSVNGHYVTTWTFALSDSGARDHTAILPASAIPKTGDTEIEFTATSALVSPMEFGGSVDPRKLGIGLISIMIE